MTIWRRNAALPMWSHEGEAAPRIHVREYAFRADIKALAISLRVGRGGKTPLALDRSPGERRRRTPAATVRSRTAASDRTLGAGAAGGTVAEEAEQTFRSIFTRSPRRAARQATGSDGQEQRRRGAGAARAFLERRRRRPAACRVPRGRCDRSNCI